MANGNPIFLPPHTRTSRLPLRAQEQKAHLVLNTVSALLGQVEAGDNDSVQKQTCDTTQFKKKNQNTTESISTSFPLCCLNWHCKLNPNSHARLSLLVRCLFFHATGSWWPWQTHLIQTPCNLHTAFTRKMDAVECLDWNTTPLDGALPQHSGPVGIL